MNLREALNIACSQFYDVPHLRDDAREDATCLLLHDLAISRATLLTSYDRVLTQEEEAAYLKSIARRIRNEPVQYITCNCEFYGLPLLVNSAVLIPRSLTEHLVESVIEELRPRDQGGESLRIVDVGTGSGAIAIALAFYLPNAQVTALDISAEALEVAAANAATNHVANRMRFLQSDLLGAVACEPHFDAVVANPPYIPSAERAELHPQIRDYEPEIALYGGPTGLDVYRLLVPQARAVLNPGGLFAAEIGPDHVEAITALMTGWDDLHFVEDLKRMPRIAVARRR